MQTRWTVVFIDHPGTTSDVAASFWAAVSGSTWSAPRGDNGEFVTFEPKDGADPHLRLQRTDAVEAGTHLDLYVDDVASAVAEIVDTGGHVVADHGWYSVVTSPGGMRFCVVPAKGQSRRQAPVTDASGRPHSSTRSASTSTQHISRPRSASGR